MKSINLNKIVFISINVISIFVFFLPLFFNSKNGFIQNYLTLISISLVSLCAFMGFTFAHSKLTSRSLMTLIATATALGTLGRLLDFPAGGSGMFVIVIICGFSLGSQFGYIVGMSSMLISAFLIGGIGPWLGYQAIAMGLVGALAGLVSTTITKQVKRKGKIGTPLFISITLFAGFLGILYGFIINWWSWPFLDYGANLSFSISQSFAENLSNYLSFYLRTSFWWDIWAFIGNVIAISLVGRHAITALLPAREFIYPEVIFLDEVKI